MMLPRDILLSLDDLLDTRFAFMMSISPETTAKHYERYRHRNSDHEIYRLFGLDETEWRKRWNERGHDFFKRGVRTQIYSILDDLIFKDGDNEGVNHIEPSLGITINCHPYLVTDSQRLAIDTAIRDLLHPFLRIRWINRSYPDINPRWLVMHHSHVIMYDWAEWMLANIDPNENDEASLQPTMFIVPKLLSHELNEEDSKLFEQMVENGIDPLQLAEGFISPSFTLRYFNRSYWDFPEMKKSEA